MHRLLRLVGFNASCFLVALALGANAGCGDDEHSSGDNEAGDAGNAGAAGTSGTGGTAGADGGEGGGAGVEGGGQSAVGRDAARLVPGGTIMQSERFRLIGSMANGIAEGTSSASANYELHGFIAGAR